MLETQSENLKSDIVQVSHHGFNGATKELYSAISPKIALFSTPDYEWERIIKSDVNAYILNDLAIDKYIISAHGTVEV